MANEIVYVVGEDEPGTNEVHAMHLSYVFRHSENFLKVFDHEICEYLVEKGYIADSTEYVSRYGIFEYEIDELDPDVVERLALLEDDERLWIERGRKLGS